MQRNGVKKTYQTLYYMTIQSTCALLVGTSYFMTSETKVAVQVLEKSPP